ncbi:outer membrane pore protein E [Kosakonia oryzendophytica]|uniref:Outer membrane porin PhoE n=1 Tax=Kosakonia oryzendophytica TaxID=1005665 RepID=A0A1C4ATR0_9ENTR|nr:phosphoporin PhoE [Kosakonia oryzendophytica]AMO50390.1 Outer membrane pore protein E [Enterobacter sp. FY-07]WBT57357.1 phosphoporin PhoE [Kosakonia oryzendophytica]SCB97944.1 outer membrane pore protein E [Kosakonia oryzendophytica]
MKKSTLALMVMSVVASASVHAAEVYNKNGNKLDVYGKVKAMHYFSDDTTNDGDKTYVRFGFKGETQINDQLTGFGRWEAEFAGNNDETTSGQKTRLAFAGLKIKDFGSLDYGRNLGVLYDVASVTDMFPEFGGDSLARTDNFMTKRTTGVATYRNTDFFGAINGLDMTLQYQGKNENGRSSVIKQNGDGWGTSLAYDFGGSPVTLIGAYANSDRTNAQNTMALGRGEKAEAWATGVKYDANNLYLATMYAVSYNMTPVSSTRGFANKAQNFEAVVQYQFDFGLRPSLGYVLTKGKDMENGIGDEDLVNYIDVGATYYFNKNFSAMVDYKINQLKDDNKLGLANDDIVAVGVTYQF